MRYFLLSKHFIKKILSFYLLFFFSYETFANESLRKAVIVQQWTEALKIIKTSNNIDLNMLLIPNEEKYSNITLLDHIINNQRFELIEEFLNTNTKMDFLKVLPALMAHNRLDLIINLLEKVDKKFPINNIFDDENLISYAINNKNIEIIKAIKNKFINADFKTHQSKIIEFLIYKNYFEFLSEIIDTHGEGLNFNQKYKNSNNYSDGDTFIYRIITNNNWNLIDKILQKKLIIFNNNEENLLMSIEYAANKERWDIVKSFINILPEITLEQTVSKFNNLLKILIKKEKYDLIKLFLINEPTYTAKKNFNLSDIYNPKNMEVIILLNIYFHPSYYNQIHTQNELFKNIKEIFTEANKLTSDVNASDDNKEIIYYYVIAKEPKIKDLGKEFIVKIAKLFKFNEYKTKNQSFLNDIVDSVLISKNICANNKNKSLLACSHSYEHCKTDLINTIADIFYKKNYFHDLDMMTSIYIGRKLAEIESLNFNYQSVEKTLESILNF